MPALSGSLGPSVCYVPTSASLALRKIGIVLFLACVGLKSGDFLYEYPLSGQGLESMALAAAIAFIPVLITAWLRARPSVGPDPKPAACLPAPWGFRRPGLCAEDVRGP